MEPQKRNNLAAVMNFVRKKPEYRMSTIVLKFRGTEYAPYVALELNNTKMDKQLKRLVSSSVRMDGLLNISYDEYMSVVVYLPAYAEQKHIADFLEKLDMRIAKQKQLVESLKKYKRGLLNSLITQKNRLNLHRVKYGVLQNWETYSKSAPKEPLEMKNCWP